MSLKDGHEWPLTRSSHDLRLRKLLFTQFYFPCHTVFYSVVFSWKLEALLTGEKWLKVTKGDIYSTGIVGKGMVNGGKFSKSTFIFNFM